MNGHSIYNLKSTIWFEVDDLKLMNGHIIYKLTS